MRRSTTLVFVVLGAAIAGFAFSSTAGRLDEEPASPKPSVAAGPQSVDLRWREEYGPKGEQLVFEVERLDVTEVGWSARVAITNDSSVPYGVGDPRATLDRAFGLMLFATGRKAELERRNDRGTLPAVRPATEYVPALPAVLEPRASWRGTISARGALVAGSWVRVVFGALVAVTTKPTELGSSVVWITDHTYRLREPSS